MKKENKIITSNIRFTQEEKKYLIEEANKKNMNLTNYIRYKLDFKNSNLDLLRRIEILENKLKENE